MTDLFDLPFEAPKPEPEPARAEPPRRVWTVSELTLAIRDMLETRFTDVWLEGELSNCRAWRKFPVFQAKIAAVALQLERRVG